MFSLWQCIVLYAEEPLPCPKGDCTLKGTSVKQSSVHQTQFCMFKKGSSGCTRENVHSYSSIQKQVSACGLALRMTLWNTALLHNASAPCEDSVTSADLLNNNIITISYFCEFCKARMKCVPVCSSWCVNSSFPHLDLISSFLNCRVTNWAVRPAVCNWVQEFTFSNDFQEEKWDFISLWSLILLNFLSCPYVRKHTLKIEMRMERVKKTSYDGRWEDNI